MRNTPLVHFYRACVRAQYNVVCNERKRGRKQLRNRETVAFVVGYRCYMYFVKICKVKLNTITCIYGLFHDEIGYIYYTTEFFVSECNTREDVYSFTLPLLLKEEMYTELHSIVLSITSFRFTRLCSKLHPILSNSLRCNLL